MTDNLTNFSVSRDQNVDGITARVLRAPLVTNAIVCPRPFGMKNASFTATPDQLVGGHFFNSDAMPDAQTLVLPSTTDITTRLAGVLGRTVPTGTRVIFTVDNTNSGAARTITPGAGMSTEGALGVLTDITAIFVLVIESASASYLTRL